jgi:iron complex transport system substrate-binding protein
VPGPREQALPRRGVLFAGVGAAAALLAGCGGKGDGAKGDAASAKPGASKTAQAAFPVTVPGKEGSVTVRSAPRRVVAAGYLRDTDLALALGLPLVGAAKNSAFASGLAPWQKPAAKPELFDTTDGLPLEKIVALHPDLILATDDYGLAKDYASLTRIAPTLSYRTGVGADSWQTMTTRVGEATGKEAAAKRLVTRTEAAIASAKAKNAVLAGKTFTFGPVSSLSSIYTINSAADASAEFFAQLGMVLSPKVTSLPDSSTPRRAEISAEHLDLLDADVLLLAYPDPKIRKQFEAQPLFKKLKAVQRGSYIALDMGAAIALAFPSVLSIPYGLTTVVPQLVAAVGED